MINAIGIREIDFTEVITELNHTLVNMPMLIRRVNFRDFVVHPDAAGVVGRALEVLRVAARQSVQAQWRSWLVILGAEMG